MMASSKQKGDNRSAETAGSVDFDALMLANLVRVFGERDEDRRRAALRELYAEDAVLYELQAVASGWEEISSAIGSLLTSMPPGFVFSPAGRAVGHNGVGRLFWRAGPPAGPVAATGTDVAHVEGGRIKSLHVFLDPVPRLNTLARFQRELPDPGQSG